MINKRIKIAIFLLFTLSILLLGVNYARTHPNITRDIPVEYRRVYADIFPMKFMKVHISDKKYRKMSVLGGEIDWVMAWRGKSRQWHDREVHFGNLQYCKDYIVYQDSNPLPSTTRLHPSTHYIHRKRLKPYCTKAHWGGEKGKACPPLELNCSSSCLTITCAVLKHQSDKVKKLVEAGEDINQIIWDDAHFNYTTLFHAAIGMEDMDLVQFLIERGADLEIKDYNKLTPLFYSVKQIKDMSPAIVKLFLESGAKMEMNRDGKRITFEEWVKTRVNARTSEERLRAILEIAAEKRKKNALTP